MCPSLTVDMHAGRQAGQAGQAGRQAGRQADPGRQYQTGRDSDNNPARTAVPPSVPPIDGRQPYWLCGLLAAFFFIIISRRRYRKKTPLQTEHGDAKKYSAVI